MATAILVTVTILGAVTISMATAQVDLQKDEPFSPSEQKIRALRQEFTASQRKIEQKFKDFQDQMEALKKVVEHMARATYDCCAAKEEKVVPTCPNDFVTINSSCYYFSSYEVKDWHEAMKKCRTLDSRASLVALETKEEMDYIKNYLMQHKKNKINWWLGASDLDTKGVWKWAATNQPITITDWCSSEPSNDGGNEHCLMFPGGSEWFHFGGQLCWNDFPCSGNVILLMPLQFICEINMN